MREFESMSDLIQYSHSSLVLDLRNYIGACSAPAYQETLLPPPAGIYLKGEPYPLVDMSKLHFARPTLHKNLQHPQLKPLQSLHDLTPNIDVVDGDGGVVLHGLDIYKFKNLLTDTPGYKYQAIRAACYFGVKALSQLCVHSNVRPPFDYRSIFKPEAYDLVEDESLDVFNHLKYAIASFVGDDELFLYYIKLYRCTLMIQKNVDYRVFEYYRIKFAEQAEEQGQ